MNGLSQNKLESCVAARLYRARGGVCDVAWSAIKSRGYARTSPLEKKIAFLSTGMQADWWQGIVMNSLEQKKRGRVA